MIRKIIKKIIKSFQWPCKDCGHTIIKEEKWLCTVAKGCCRRDNNFACFIDKEKILRRL
ncbi:MAG: hypothetical protein K0Q47_109 [Sedimentibacter sp.]|jgi:hypothetical protein|nr:hypothetical protein [Sedimentibacter sp.]